MLYLCEVKVTIWNVLFYNNLIIREKYEKAEMAQLVEQFIRNE